MLDIKKRKLLAQLPNFTENHDQNKLSQTVIESNEQNNEDLSEIIGKLCEYVKIFWIKLLLCI